MITKNLRCKAIGKSLVHAWGGFIKARILSPIGPLGITVFKDKLIGLNFLPDSANLENTDNPQINTVKEQLEKYFSNSKTIFNLPLNLVGTPFQKKVWQALTEIQPGQTLTYKALAEKLQSSPRAIGNACRQNPLPIIVPCHRITSQNGLGGYCGQTAGKMMQIKQWLLHHEQNGENSYEP